VRFIAGIILLIAMVRGFILLRHLQRSIRVVGHAWWLDTNALPNIEWASLARYGDNRVDVLTAGGERFELDDTKHAEQWLRDANFVPANEATKAGTDAMPPPLALRGLRDDGPT
jgi:hypothetical protein